MGGLALAAVAFVAFALLKKGGESEVAPVPPTLPPDKYTGKPGADGLRRAGDAADAEAAKSGDWLGTTSVVAGIGTSVVGTGVGILKATGVIGATGGATGATAGEAAGVTAAAGAGSAAVGGAVAAATAAGATAGGLTAAGVTTGAGTVAASSIGSAAAAGATSAGAGGGAAAATTAGTTVAGATAASSFAWGAYAGAAAVVIAFIVISLVMGFAIPVVLTLNQRARFGIAGLVANAKNLADQYANELILKILNAGGASVTQSYTQSDLPPTATRPEILAYNYFPEAVSGVADKPLLRDTYRACQALGLALARTQNEICWVYLAKALRLPNETDNALRARLAGAGLAMSPSDFNGAEVDFWSKRQALPWGDAAPIDPSSGTAQAERGLDYFFGADKARIVAGARMQGAATAYNWLKANQDLLSRPNEYRLAFTAAGFQQIGQSTGGSIVWKLAALPKFMLVDGQILPDVSA